MKRGDKMEKRTITYKGKSIETKNFCEVSPQELEEIRNEYYKKPNKDLVLKQMKKVYSGGVMIDKITRYYFRDLMAKTLCFGAKWSVEEVFESVDLCGIFKAKVLNSPKVFSAEKGMSKNIERAISLGGKGYARIPTQFPLKTADTILEKYNINNNIYDFSCGWGARLVSALKHNANYYGTDPNYELCYRLEELKKDWKDIIKTNSTVKIFPQGSQYDIPELHNKIGLAFSSPPYFSLEDYKIGEQSYKEGMTLDNWYESYVYPTIKNIFNYLIKDGYLALNIKDTNYPLVKTFEKAINNFDFEYVETIPLKNIKRLKSSGGLTDSTDELIYIYKKLI